MERDLLNLKAQAWLSSEAKRPPREKGDLEQAPIEGKRSSTTNDYAFKGKGSLWRIHKREH